MNDPLQVLNEALRQKITELEQINASHENLLNSSEDGVLYVDKDCRILRFNPAISCAFDLSPDDIGCPLDKIAFKLTSQERLLADVRSVIESGVSVEREASALSRNAYLQRINACVDGEGDNIGAILTFIDVTELNDLERHFQFAVEAAGLSWWVWDVAEDDFEVYSAGRCILGENCLGVPLNRQGWIEMVHPDDQPEVVRTLNAFIDGETEQWVCEHRFRRIDGEWLWVANHGQATARDAEGKALRVLGTTQDIDASKKAFIDLNHHKDVLEAAEDISGMGAWEYNPASNSIHWSDQVNAILGLEDDLEISLEESFDFFLPEDRPLLQAAFEKAVHEGLDYSLDLRGTNRRGEPLLLRTAGRPRHDAQGRLISISGILQDVTKDRTAEHEVHAFFELSPDYQASINRQGQFFRFNPAWSKQLGYSKSELRRMHLVDVLPEKDRARLNAALERARGGEVVQNLETGILAAQASEAEPSAEEGWVLWSLSYEPELGHVFISGRDVTNQKIANRELDLARIRAVEANRAKSDFLAIMSHELRTPLNPVLGYSEALLEETENEEHRKILRTIVESGEHLVGIIDQILDFSKLEAGKIGVDPVEFELESFVEKMIRLMSGQRQSETVLVKAEIDPGPCAEGLPLFVCDVSLLRRVLRNLLGNALKFTFEGSVILRVRVESLLGEAAVVQFEVEDTGIGIPLDRQNELFEPFVQVDSGATRKYEGTGLGLSICRSLVEILGSEIRLESSPGAGSKFGFSLAMPVRQASPPELVELSAVETKKAAWMVPPTMGRALVVDDNGTNRLLFDRLLTMLGCKVVLASSGEEALELLEAEKFAIVFLDLHMAGIGGLEVLKSIRGKEKEAKSRHIPVSILTADVAIETREECIRLGADAFLEKPISIKQLRDALSPVVADESGVL